VKGIWKQPPPGWPSDIGFVDPNNKMKTGNGARKPKKELLIPMLEHLVMKYQVSAVFDCSNVCLRDNVVTSHYVHYDHSITVLK